MGFCIKMELRYDPKDTAKLWELLKDHKTPYWSQPPGIRAVKFVQSLEELEKLHSAGIKEKNPDMETIVLTDIKKAIEILSRSHIWFHRLSCIAHEGIGDYTAIFINCDNPEEGKLSVVIPGLNYIYPS